MKKMLAVVAGCFFFFLISDAKAMSVKYFMGHCNDIANSSSDKSSLPCYLYLQGFFQSAEGTLLFLNEGSAKEEKCYNALRDNNGAINLAGFQGYMDEVPVTPSDDIGTYAHMYIQNIATEKECKYLFDIGKSALK